MKNIIFSGGYRENNKYNHTHEKHEIIYYTAGKGEITVGGEQRFVKKGDISIIPPKTMHGTISKENLQYISVTGDLGNLIKTHEYLLIKDNDDKEAEQLIKLIFANRYGSEEYYDSLCLSLVHYILQKVKVENETERAVEKIRKEIIRNFNDSRFSLIEILNKSGYSEDYIRSIFKKITNKTPIEYLNEIRIDHAKDLIKAYKNSLPLSEIALNCGYVDYIYFSRKFKEIIGESPINFRKRVCK